MNSTGGFRRRATFIKQQRQDAPDLLLLDTGDALIGGGQLGDQTQGKAVVDGMNLMGYDAMALGPKELSLGESVLRQRMDEAQFPMLSANVILSSTGEFLAEPYVVLEVGDHRLGVIGLTRVPDAPIPGFGVLDPWRAAGAYVPEVAEVADTVVILTNLPWRTAMEVAGFVTDVDLLVAALPDQPPSEAVLYGPSTLAVSAEQPAPRHTGRQVGRLVAALQGDGSLAAESWESRPMGGQIPDDPEMTALLNKYAR